MLYTGKGDNGKTTTFGCNQKISKSSAITEALGSLDEINSFLGIIKVKAFTLNFKINNFEVGQIIETIQQNLFIIQAELAGSDMKISEEKLRECEKLVSDIEKELPPIKTFFVSGGTELASAFDFARTVARRAERRVVQVSDEGQEIGEFTLAYLNRLSSLLYALARFSNHCAKIDEIKPSYK